MRVTIPQNIEAQLQARANNHEWLAHCIVDDNLKKFPYRPSEKGKGTIDPHDYYPSLLPRDKSVGSDKTCYLVNVPLAHRAGPLENQRVKGILEILKDQSFGTSIESSRREVCKRLGVVIGINRSRSVDPAVNRAFEEYIHQLPLIDNIVYRVFGFFWSPAWEQTRAKAYKLEKAFMLLKVLDHQRAERVRNSLEGAESLCSQIPFQSIREMLKTHTTTRSLLRCFEEVSPQAPIYFGPMDADFSKLRQEEGVRGLFSRYDRIVQTHNPSVMSLGYAVAEDELPLIQLGVRVDMAVREAMNGVIGGSCYFPEPSTLFLVRRPEETNYLDELSFCGVGRTLENRRFIMKGIADGLIDQDKMVFQAGQGVTTGTPERMKTKKNRQVEELTVKKIKQKKYLQALRDVSQTHATPKQWADNLYLALPITCSCVTDITTPMMYIFKAFDPISLAFSLADRYSAAVFDFVMNNYDDYSEVMLGENSDDLSDYPDLEEREEFVSGMVNLLETQKTKLIELKLNDEWVEKIVQAAVKSGKAIHRTLSDYIDEIT